MICKVLKKLRLGVPAAKLLLPLSSGKGGCAMTAEEAEALLTAHSPDPAASCYVPETDFSDPRYDLDIIVPVYNVAQFLPACIESLLSQKTRFSYRVIFVDDGSTDESGAILDALADPRALVIHQENRGLSGARNTGIEASSACYLLFLDSDDRLAEGAVEALLSAAEETGAVLVQGCFATFTGEKNPRRELSMGKPLLLDPPAEKLPGYAWGKLVRFDRFFNLRFPRGYWFEDTVNAMVLFPLLRRDGALAAGIDQIVCHYRQNPQGISLQSRRRPRAIDSFWITRQMYKDRKQFALENTQEDYETLLDMILLTFERTAWQPENVQQAIMILWQDLLTREYPGFASRRPKMQALDQAMNQKNYPQYRLCCKLL